MNSKAFPWIPLPVNVKGSQAALQQIFPFGFTITIESAFVTTFRMCMKPHVRYVVYPLFTIGPVVNCFHRDARTILDRRHSVISSLKWNVDACSKLYSALLDRNNTPLSQVRMATL
jgi:hypothetical protein